MKIKELILTSLFAALTALGALIAIPLPFSPVPVTLQILFTLLAGVVLGSQMGALSQLVYLFLGGMGLPVFAGGSGGFDKLIGPTAGYLWGFVIAAFIVGLVTEKSHYTILRNVTTMIIGLIVIYLSGILVLHWVAGLDLVKAFYAGVLPFIPGDLAKIAVVTFLSHELHKRLPTIMGNYF